MDMEAAYEKKRQDTKKIFENKFNDTEEDIRKIRSAIEKNYKKHLEEIK